MKFKKYSGILILRDMKLLHLTDTHLDHLHLKAVQSYCRKLKRENPDIVVITGDISNANMLFEHLLVLRKELAPCPVFFVAGNHDYYHGSIEEIRAKFSGGLCVYEGPAKTLPSGEGAWWLGCSGVIHLTDTHALVGSDGWYDGGYADWFKSQLDMNDYYLIRELSGPRIKTRQERFDALQVLSGASADYVRTQLQAAFDAGYKTCYVATHVPPFKESSVYRGKVSDDTWLPHFSSKKMGEALTQVCLANPDNQAIVLCGHTHGASTYFALKNLTVLCGAAEYGDPSIANEFNL